MDKEYPEASQNSTYARTGQGYIINKEAQNAYATSAHSSLFDYYQPREASPPRQPDGVSIYNLITRASEFTTFLKPFIAIEKKLKAATKKRDAAEEAVMNLRMKREDILREILSA